MPRTKQIKYDKFKADVNCLNYDFGDDNSIALVIIQNWAKDYSGIMVELCAGYCEYSLDYSAKNLDTLCIAIDIKEDRLMYANRLAKEQGLKNIRFIRTYINNLDKLFDSNIDTIYLVHPDPQVNKKRIRLNQPKFVNIYYSILKPNGVLNLMTDNNDFYNEFLNNIGDFMITQNIINGEKSEFEVLKTRYNVKFINEDNPTKILILNRTSEKKQNPTIKHPKK
jgi:tRNA (guanine-N7-)-methyltransferase